jgi:hypothetical protein
MQRLGTYPSFQKMINNKKHNKIAKKKEKMICHSRFPNTKQAIFESFVTHTP